MPIIKKQCDQCKRPLSVITVCRWCGKEVDPIKSSTLILIASGLFLLGYLIGFCIKM